MFKYYNKLEDIRQVLFVGSSVFHKSKNKHYKLIERNTDDLSVIWESDQNNVIDYNFINNSLIFTSKDNETSCFLILDRKQEKFRFNFIFAFDKELQNETYLVGNSRREGIIIIDLAKGNFFSIAKEDFSAYILINLSLVCINKNKSLVTNRTIYNDSLLLKWQFDIAQFGSYKDIKMFADREPEERQREINRVYYYNNKIIVTLSRAIIAIEPEMGQLLWKIDTKDFNPYDIVFDHNTGYVGDGLSYVVADIEKGQIIYEREFDNTLRVNIEGSSLSHILYNNLTLHQNFLWFTYGTGGNRFLLKANPANGDIVDGMLLDTKLPTHPPVFDKNRMYLLDQDGNLYVYEKT